MLACSTGDCRLPLEPRAQLREEGDIFLSGTFVMYCPYGEWRHTTIPATSLPSFLLRMKDRAAVRRCRLSPLRSHRRLWASHEKLGTIHPLSLSPISLLWVPLAVPRTRLLYALAAKRRSLYVISFTSSLWQQARAIYSSTLLNSLLYSMKVGGNLTVRNRNTVQIATQ